MKGKINKKLLGIVLTFFTTGLIATGMDSSAYEDVYAQQDRQETAVKKLLQSEFVSAADHKELQQTVNAVNQAEKRATRGTLQKKITAEQQLLKQIGERAKSAEKQAAAKEWEQLDRTLADLATASDDPFTEKNDIASLAQLQIQASVLKTSAKVAPIRDLATDAEDLAQTLGANQQQLKTLTGELKKTNQTIGTLLKKQYLLAADKEALVAEEQSNRDFFEKADDLQLLQARQEKSRETAEAIAKRLADSEADFKEHRGAADKLLAAVTGLLTDNQLEPAEKTQLQEKQQQLSAFLQLKGYQPGDLGSGHEALQTEYEAAVKAVNKRKAAAEKAAAEKAAAEQKAREEAAAQAAAQAAQGAAAQPQALAGSGTTTPTPSVSGGWHQAPDGYKFLKVESGKTYGQVKNPNNFSLITVAEAANYTPGHGNGSAKQ